QWHADPAQCRDEPGRFDLSRVVVPVPGLRVDRGGRQQPDLVVQAQRLRCQPGRAGEGPDGQRGHIAILPVPSHRGRYGRGWGLPEGQGQAGKPAGVVARRTLVAPRLMSQAWDGVVMAEARTVGWTADEAVTRLFSAHYRQLVRLAALLLAD